MPTKRYTSWGRVLRAEHEVLPLESRGAGFPALGSASHVLPYGNGRSYGDSCLNPGGALLPTERLDRFIHFDPATGILACEAGMLLAEILRLVVPQGWFLPVTPGTRYVTLGGCIANDVHGKNHHVAGTFSRHLRRFELLRSDGRRLLCSPTENPDYFAATVGGLGLTGLVTWAEIQLRRIGNPWIDAETLRYGTLDEFFELCGESDRDYEYTVSWIDCSGGGRRLGRGLFMRGNHAPAGIQPGEYRPRALTFPPGLPVSAVNPLSLKLFNTLYYHRQRARQLRETQHYEPFFYPLDGILAWNRMYGPRGFYQYQCVVPGEPAREAIALLLREIGRSGMGSFLAVLKVCGELASPGLLSFPQPGVSLALDFPNRGEKLFRLFIRLDAIVGEAGGRLYPAKDGRMPAAMFRAGYPRWREFTQYLDPCFSSSFWRRVMEDR